MTLLVVVFLCALSVHHPHYNVKPPLEHYGWGTVCGAPVEHVRVECGTGRVKT